MDENFLYHTLLSNKITSSVIHNNYSILELKYNIENNEYVSKLASVLPLKQTKYSKYITGIDSFRIHPWASKGFIIFN